MKLHDVRLKDGTRQPRKRVGRGHGSGTGKTSGRGHKGAKSRSGYKHKAAFEGGQMPLVRSLPKRGFSNYPFRKAWAEVNLSQLARFDAGSTVDPQSLADAGLVKGKFDGIVILGRGEVEGALTVKAHRFSKTAAAKIEAAGGTVEVIG
ncbi:MAG: 50S ribosomal protein L15 [Acidobacteriota bacterium]|jgi:large subunit ribosomal protein L15